MKISNSLKILNAAKRAMATTSRANRFAARPHRALGLAFLGVGAMSVLGLGNTANATDAYWLGGINNVWSTLSNGTSNWAANGTGTANLHAIPTAASDVIFSANGAANKNTVLGSDLQISSLTVNDPAAVTIGGANTLTIAGTGNVPGITIASGAGPTTMSCNLLLSSSSQAIAVNSGSVLSISGTIGGAIDLIKAGYGSMSTSARNNYTGDTTITAGQLTAGISNAIPSQSAVSVYGGALFDLHNFDQSIGSLADHGDVMLGSATLTTGNDNTSTTFTGVIGGSGNVAKTGTGAWALTGSHLYTGVTNVNQGALIIGDGVTAGASIGSSSGVNVASGAVLGMMLTNGETFSNSVANNGTVVARVAGTNTFAGAIGGTGSFVQFGGGTAILTAQNTYIGETVVQDGILQTGIAHAISEQSAVSVYGGALFDLHNFDQSIGSLADHGDVMLGSATLTTGNDNTSTTFTGVIGGSGNVVKTGAGVWDLTGSHLYTGVTNVNQGTLVIGNGVTAGASIASSSGVHISNGAVLGVALANGETFSNSVANNGTVMALAAGTNIFAGVQSGNGNFIQLGDGKSILTGHNTYTGATMALKGTLQIGDGSTLGTSISPSSQTLVDTGATLAVNLAPGESFSSNVIVNANGVVNTTASGINTLAGVISGGGGLVQSGSGITILTGSNTYTGDTVILNGTLRAGQDRVFRADSQNSVQFIAPVVDPATLGISEAASIVSGAATYQRTNMILDRPGTFDVNGTQQFVGILKDGANGGGSVNLGSSATPGSLEILVSGTDNFSGNIQGSGLLVKAGSGTWVFSGSSYDASFSLREGTLQTGKANVFSAGCDLGMDPNATFDLNNHNQAVASLSGSGTVNLGSATLTVSGSENHIFSGVIQGDNGGVVKQGAGTWTMEGNNTYTGMTTVNEGKLVMNGMVAGSALVQNGGTLGGSGKIAGNLVNEGAVSPGNSPGKLTVAGNYTQTSSGTLSIEIASNTLYDQVAVGGKASLNGTLTLTWLNGYVPVRGDRLTILTAANGITGEFSNVNSPQLANSILSLGVTYQPNGIVLETVHGEFAALQGLTPNELAVAQVLDPVIYNKGVAGLIDLLDATSVDALPSVLRRIVPVEYTVVYDAGIATSNVQEENLERRMQEIRNGVTGFSTNGLSLTDPHGTLTPVADPKEAQPIGKDGKELAPAQIDPRWGFFINGSGEFVGESRTEAVSRSSFNTGGITLGADYRLGQNAAIGLTAGYTNMNTAWSGNGSLENNGGKAGVYGTVFNDGFFLNGVAGGGFNSYAIRRDTLGGTARGDTGGNDFNALLGTGYTYRTGGWSLGPISSLRYTWVGLNGFNETDSLAPLRLKDQSEDSLRSTAGMQLSYALDMGKVVVTPEVRAQWQHEYLYNHGQITASFAEGSPFTISGPTLGRDSALLDAGVTVQFTPQVALYSYYTTELGRSNYSSHNLFGGVQITFF